MRVRYHQQWHAHMQMNRHKLIAIVLLTLTACAGFPFFDKRELPRAQLLEKAGRLAGKSHAHSRARLELYDTRYDGLHFWGRLLISPVEGPLLLDKRIIPTVDVDVSSVRECSTGERLKHMVIDIVPPSISEENVLILEPGYWYGGEVRFSLFAEAFTGVGPECVEVELSLLSFDRRLVGSIFARTTRILQHSMDGGTQGDSPPAMDAGVPVAGTGEIL